MDVNSDDLDAGSIAIVGLAGRFPAARTAAELWSLLAAGKEATQWMSDADLRAAGVSDAQLQDPDYVRASLVLPDMEMFDADFFGFSKRDASVLDPQHRHFLECAWEALEDAGHMPESFNGSIGVFGGCGMQAYLPYNLLTNPALVKSMGLFLLRHTGNDKDFLTTRLSYLLDLKGPSMSIQTACSTSLVAVHVASQSLLSGECDMALAGGVSIELPHRQGYQYAEGEIMSPDGHCRAFDENANGTVFGSGAAVVVLRRLSDAIRDRDNIYAVIRGSAVNNDGYQKAGYLAPSVDGQASAAVEALAVAGVDPATVSYIEAHGTGTPVGDPIEIAALTQAYGAAAAVSCGIGSLKTNIGHLDTAAGAASLIKVSLALRHGLIPPSLNFSEPNNRFDIAKTPFYVVDQAKPWPRSTQARRAAVNSLGVGGTNAHVIVEEAPALPDRNGDGGDGDWQVLTLSARTPASLQNLKTKWRDFLAQAPASLRLLDAAYTTQVGRKAFDHRCALVARDIAGLQTALEGKGNVRAVTAQAAPGQPAVVMMFAGGGAQYPGAGRELLAQPAFLQAVDACFSMMPPGVPADLRAVMFDADVQDAAAARKLEQPTYALTALFTLEYALAKLWENWGIKPAAVMGHSAGEYTAACLAGVMSLEDALSVVFLRGQLFETVPAGAMLSVDLPEAELRQAIEGMALDIAAINGPDLCIASGSLDAIAQLEQRLAQQSVECRRLRIDVAAHSRLLDGVLDTFRARVSTIALRPPTVTFISNLTGAPVEAQTLTDPEYWVRHLRNPVRFADGLNQAFALPHCVLLEVGPGQGLCALARQNSAGQPRTIVPSTGKAQGDQGDLAVMLLSAGALWARGALPDWQALRGGEERRRISVPTYAFDHQRHWVEPGSVLHSAPAAAPPVALAAPAPLLTRLEHYDDWFSVPEWQPRPLPPPIRSGEPDGQIWLVFGNRSQLTAGLVDRIGDAGASVVVVRRGEAFAKLADGSFTVKPDEASHYASLFDSLAQSGLLPGRILHLWSLDTNQGPAGLEISGQALAFDSLVQTARAIQLLDYTQPISLTVITAGSQSVAGEAIPHPERALALGPCRVIPREMPALHARLVDFSSADVSSDYVLQAILDECQADPDSDLVAYRDRQRWALQMVAAGVSSQAMSPSRIRQGGVYLISGGLGDIALALADFLAHTHQARLALVSRRALPPKASWRESATGGSPEARVLRRLLACEEAGGEVLCIAADVSDPAAMAWVVADCRAHFGVINGVFHAAGTLDDGPIATKTPESVQRVLGPKAVGAQVLHGLLPPGDLDFFAVFSSTSVYLGAAGQVDYVAANAFIDALAASRADGLSIHWGIWGDSGMAARAYGSHALERDGRSAVHPLLGVQVADVDGAVFEASYSAAHLWVLREHGVAGRPVLPGTGYIEIARAAMAVLHPGQAVEIRALSFEEAMVFDAEAARQVRIELRRTGEGYDLLVRSRSDASAPWIDHARAGVGPFLGRLDAAPPTSAQDWVAGEIPQAHVVAFGPRWSNIARMQIGTQTALADMHLPPRFAGDLAEYGAHPALTDMAATFGLHLIDALERDGKLFVPLSIERIRLVAAVPADFFCHVERKNVPGNRLVAFDASLYAADASPIATFEGFSLRGVLASAVTDQAQQAGTRRERSLIETMLACGIKAEDSHEVFARMLVGSRRDLTVSSIALDDLARVIAQSTSRVAPSMPGGGGQTASDNAGGASMNPVERAIAEVWRDLLGVQEVEPGDDFFALGGHSLAAVRLFAKIRKQFGVDLPLATLFQAPTLAELSRVVCESGGLDTTEAVEVLKKISATVAPLPKKPWSPLVAINKGDATRTPIFCVHGAGGNVLNFKVISDRLGRDQPFYGLQAQGVDGSLEPLTTVEAMASQYLQAIRSVSETGPYRLAGYSGGGVIAYEMAQQLIASGAWVEFLGLIDTLSPDAARKKVSLPIKLALARRWTFKFALKWPERRRIAREMRQRDADQLTQLLRSDPMTPELIEFNLFRTFVAAQAKYVVEPYAGSMLMFRADQAKTAFPDPAYLAADNSLGWSAHVSGGVRVVDVPGSHITMLADPGLSVMIAGWKGELARLDNPNAPPSVKVSAVGGAS